MSFRLLRVVRSLDPRSGGPVEGICQITPHLQALGVETSVATLDPSDSPWLSELPFQTYPLGPVLGHYGYRRFLPRIIRDLSLRHDCVIVHDIWQYNAYATWRALRGTNIPYYVYTHGMLDPWFKRTYPLKHVKKWLYWPWATYRLLRDSNAVLFTTDQERLLARKSFWLYKATECVVGYGTSPPPDEPELQKSIFLQRFPHLHGKRILLFLSRIHPKKGLDLLIQAFSQVYTTDYRLHLVIAGPDTVGLQSVLHAQAVSLGIDHLITWTGMLRHEIKWGAYRSAELFCLPSHQENFGIAVSEALACALPVAISHPVNISSDVISANAGIVYADNLDGLIHALRRWLSLSPCDRNTLSGNALNLFHRRYDYEKIAASLIPVLKGDPSALHTST